MAGRSTHEVGEDVTDPRQVLASSVGITDYQDYTLEELENIVNLGTATIPVASNGIGGFVWNKVGADTAGGASSLAGWAPDATNTQTHPRVGLLKRGGETPGFYVNNTSGMAFRRLTGNLDDPAATSTDMAYFDANNVWSMRGGFAAPVTYITAATYSATTNDTFIEMDRAAGSTLTLPGPGAQAQGKIYFIRTNSGALTINVAGGGNIEGQTSIVLNAQETAIIVGDTVNWVIYSRSYGGVVTPALTVYTPTFVNITGGAGNFAYKVAGKLVTLRWAFTAGTVTATAITGFTLPSGVVIISGAQGQNGAGVPLTCTTLNSVLSTTTAYISGGNNITSGTGLTGLCGTAVFEMV